MAKSEIAPVATTEQAPGGVRGKALAAAVEKALEVQQPLVAGHVAAVRRKRPGATPAQVIETLGRQYQAAVATTGGVGGAIAILPAVGTVVSLATASAEAVAALDASVLYTLAVAEVHALPTEDPQRRKALVLGIVLGEGGQALLSKVTGKSRDWASDIMSSLPLAKLGPLNSSLSRWFIKRYITRQVALALGRALPLGIGLAIGAVGNVITARAVIASAEQAFGAAPATWPGGTASITAR